MTDQSKPGRQDKLLQRLDAGARHQDYPEAFGESWSQLCRDAAAAIRRLAAKPADEGVVCVSAQSVMDSRNKQFGFAWDLNEAICDAIDDGKTESRDIAARVTTNPKIKEWLKLLPPPSTTGEPKR